MNTKEPTSFFYRFLNTFVNLISPKPSPNNYIPYDNIDESISRVVDQFMEESKEEVVDNYFKETKEESIEEVVDNIIEETKEEVVDNYFKESKEKVVDNIIEETKEEVVDNIIEESEEKVVDNYFKESEEQVVDNFIAESKKEYDYNDEIFEDYVESTEINDIEFDNIIDKLNQDIISEMYNNSEPKTNFCFDFPECNTV